MKASSIRSFAALLVVVLMLTLVAACSSGKPNASSSPSAASSTEGGNQQENKQEVVELSFYSFDSNGKAFPWESAVHQRITEKTGVKLKMEYVVGTNLEEKVGVMIAGQDYADIIEARGVQGKLRDAGALVPLDDLIEQYGPNIKRAFGDSLEKLRNPQDGKIYFIPSPKVKPEEITDANQSLLIQYDVLDKLGYPKLETLDDVYQALKKYMEMVPDLNGQPWVPWGIWTDTWGYNITVNNAALWVNGLTDDSDALVDQETFDVTYFARTDMFRDYLVWLNKLYREGMIDENAFIIKNDQYKSLVASGRVLAMIDGTWNISDSEKALRQAGMPERAYARMPIVKAKGIKDRSQVLGESYAWGLGISVNAKDQAAAMRLLDWLATDEGAVTLNWGVEGIHYDVIDGKRVVKPEVAEKLISDADYKWKEGLRMTWNQVQGAIKLDDGQYAAPFNVDDVYNNSDDWTRKVMDAYGVKAWGQMFDVSGEKPPYGYAWSISLPADSPGQLAASKAEDLRAVKVPGIIMAANEQEFEQRWQDFTKGLEDVNIQSWEAEMSEGIKERLKLWGVLE